MPEYVSEVEVVAFEFTVEPTVHALELDAVVYQVELEVPDLVAAVEVEP